MAVTFRRVLPNRGERAATAPRVLTSNHHHATMPPRRVEVESDSGDEFDDGLKNDKGKAKAKDVLLVLARHRL